MTIKVAVIGLGSMGYGIATSAVKAGLTVYGFDVNAAQVSRFEAEGGLTGSVADAGKNISTAIIVVLNAAQTEATLFGPNGIVQHMTKGSVVVACATVAPDFARDMAARCAAHDVLYIDAPISGGSIKAATGALTIMAAGPDKAFDAASPVFDAISEKVFRLGAEAGAGSAMKAVNQLLAGVHIAAMAEAMTFGISQGVTPEAFMEVIPDCAGTSWMLENRGPHIVEGDYTPHSSVNIWPKDLGIVLDIARSSGFGAPIAAAALQQFLAASGSGLGHEDDAAVAKVYARNAGLTLPTGKRDA